MPLEDEVLGRLAQLPFDSIGGGDLIVASGLCKGIVLGFFWSWAGGGTGSGSGKSNGRGAFAWKSVEIRKFCKRTLKLQNIT